MRKVLLVGALLAVVASPALALTNIDVNTLQSVSNTWTAKYSNYSDLYYANLTPAQAGVNAAAGVNGAPVLFGAPSSYLSNAVTAYQTAGGDSTPSASFAPGTLENRAIFQTTTLIAGSTGTHYNPTQQLSGLFYNLTLAGATPSIDPITGKADIILDFVPNTRSTPLAAEAAARALAGNPLPAGCGGVLQVYINNAQTFTPDPNHAGVLTNASFPQPVATVTGSTQVNNGLNAPGSAGTWGPQNWHAGAGATSDSVPGSGATDGTDWLDGVFVPFGLLNVTAGDGDPNTVFEETYVPTVGTGSATAWIDWVGGSEYPIVQLGATKTTGINVDGSLIADESAPGVSTDGVTLEPPPSVYDGTGWWPVSSQDPVTFQLQAIPEPCTMTLLGLGLASLLIRRRK